MAEERKPQSRKQKAEGQTAAGPKEGRKSEAKAKAPARKPAAKPAAKKEAAPKRQPAGKPAAKATPKAAPSRPAAEEPRPVVRASARYLRVPPRKARLVADQIRGLGIADARALLDFSSRSAARDLRKLLDSAAANAENNHDLVADDLRIADIHVDDGPTLRRYRPRALGRATRIDKRTSHVSLSLTPED